MKDLKLFISIFIISTSLLFSQVDETKITRTISASKLAKEILADNNEPVVYENVRFEGDVIIQEIDDEKMSELKHIRISKKIEFKNCVFEGFYAQKCVFDSTFTISWTTINNRFNCSYSKFLEKVYFSKVSFNDETYFEGVVFY